MWFNSYALIPRIPSIPVNSPSKIPASFRQSQIAFTEDCPTLNYLEKSEGKLKWKELENPPSFIFYKIN
jgi:hypothetical protein